MKILVVTHDIDAGGAARSLSVLVQHLHAFGHDLEIVTLLRPDPRRTPWQIYSSRDIPVYHMPFPWIAVGYSGIEPPSNVFSPEVRRQHAATLQAVQQFSPDVVFFNGYPPMGLAPYVKAKRKVLIAREVVDEGSPLLKQVVKGLQRNLDQAIAIGPVEAEQLARWNIPCEIVFNTSRVRPRFTPPPPMPPIHFGCFGHLFGAKGQLELVIAAAAVSEHLRAAGAQIRICGSGGGEYKENLFNFIEAQNLEDIVKIEGWVNDVEAAMQEMHCIIRPDLTGSPWGRDIIEAMSLGRPVLATGTQDVFVKPGLTGWLVPPGNPEDLARMLVALCGNPKRLEKAGKQAFAFAATQFDPETNARRIEALLCG